MRDRIDRILARQNKQLALDALLVTIMLLLAALSLLILDLGA